MKSHLVLLAIGLGAGLVCSVSCSGSVESTHDEVAAVKEADGQGANQQKDLETKKLDARSAYVDIIQRKIEASGGDVDVSVEGWEDRDQNTLIFTSDRFRDDYTRQEFLQGWLEGRSKQEKKMLCSIGIVAVRAAYSRGTFKFNRGQTFGLGCSK